LKLRDALVVQAIFFIGMGFVLMTGAVAVDVASHHKNHATAIAMGVMGITCDGCGILLSIGLFLRALKE
jgi:hypothetical protein